MTTFSNKPRLSLLALTLAGAVSAIGCGDDSDPMEIVTDGGPDKPDSGPTPEDGGVDPDPDAETPEPDNCPDIDDLEPEYVPGAIAEDVTWDCKKLWVLQERSFVTGGATVTIKPGTTIMGLNEGALFVSPTGRIDAVGTAAQPIVFTSANDPGDRAPEDWQGVILLGDAPINAIGGSKPFEGLTGDEFRYGGTDDEHDCGRMSYVRIEFAGFEIVSNAELNSLTVAGCGSKTQLDHIQTHMGADDGIEFFGGSANIKYAVISAPYDDGLDWDEGWTGSAQFVAIQQSPAQIDSENGFEADNNDKNDAEPYTDASVYNVTMIGNKSTKSVGMVIREGLKGDLKNVLAVGFSGSAIDVQNTLTGTHLEDGDLSVTNSMFFECGPLAAEAAGTAADDDGGFSEQDFFTKAEYKNVFNKNPKLPKPYDVAAPGWVPPSDSPAKDGAATPPGGGFFDTSAEYIGAFEPGGDDWTKGWTAYPKD